MLKFVCQLIAIKSSICDSVKIEAQWLWKNRGVKNTSKIMSVTLFYFIIIFLIFYIFNTPYFKRITEVTTTNFWLKGWFLFNM